MRVDDFNFELPEEQIALRPTAPRDAARLLVVRGPGGFEDKAVCDLPSLLNPGDLLVLNDTQVMPVRLRGWRGGVPIEATLLAPDGGPGCWLALAKPGKRLRPTDEIDFGGTTARVLEKREGGEILLEFSGDVAALIERVGVMPLPPYIAGRRAPDERDMADYQTLYAAREGAIAAPTAGLHFTDRLFAALDRRGVTHEFITLHIGAGTFLPVKTADTEDHRMHGEWGEIAPETAERINAARAAGGRIVAVGTTALRLLESAADREGRIQPFSGHTNLFITPGYKFRSVDLLWTNFHLPKSTLFMLVAAFSGLDVMTSAYAHAIRAGYRFYSYGDVTLLYPAGEQA